MVVMMMIYYDYDNYLRNDDCLQLNKYIVDDLMRFFVKGNFLNYKQTSKKQWVIITLSLFSMIIAIIMVTHVHIFLNRLLQNTNYRAHSEKLNNCSKISIISDYSNYWQGKIFNTRHTYTHTHRITLTKFIIQ